MNAFQGVLMFILVGIIILVKYVQRETQIVQTTNVLANAASSANFAEETVAEANDRPILTDEIDYQLSTAIIKPEEDANIYEKYGI